MNHCLQVELGERSYPIHIGPGLLKRNDLLQELLDARQIVVITNQTVGPLYSAPLRARLGAAEVYEMVIPDGEHTKSLAVFGDIMTFLLENRIERSAVMVALGGGVIGDLVGFAAASYQRGIKFVQIPTTLLAQVDSSVGGKTAVNHPLGKNMIGAFHQPCAVIADLDTLSTLPEREFRAGLAEVIKYGLIQDAEFFSWLEECCAGLLVRDPETLAQAVLRSCQNKASVVAADEREGGIRALLNLGHTFGHAIETHAGYGKWLHGEAVAAGTMLAARMSRNLGWITADQLEQIAGLLQRCGLPLKPPEGMGAEDFLEHMAHDKKNADGRITLILLQGIGHAVVCRDYAERDLRAVLESV